MTATGNRDDDEQQSSINATILTCGARPGRGIPHLRGPGGPVLLGREDVDVLLVDEP